MNAPGPETCPGGPPLVSTPPPAAARMSPHVLTVKTSSGATAVQIVYSFSRGSREIEHVGSAHDDAEVELLRPLRASVADRAGQARLGLQPVDACPRCTAASKPKRSPTPGTPSAKPARPSSSTYTSAAALPTDNNDIRATAACPAPVKRRRRASASRAGEHDQTALKVP
jgi:hypothetical protein